jgi:hypothetical protein
MANTLMAIMKISTYFGYNDLALLPMFGAISCHFGTDGTSLSKIERGCVRRWLKVDALHSICATSGLCFFFRCGIWGRALQTRYVGFCTPHFPSPSPGLLTECISHKIAT